MNGISESLIWSKTLMELIFNPCGEFWCEVQRAQLAKSTLLTSTFVPLGSFQIFQGLFRCWRESEVRIGMGSYCIYLSPVKQQPWSLSLQWKTCLWQNCTFYFWVCSERPALRQNTLMMMMMMMMSISWKK